MIIKVKLFLNVFWFKYVNKKTTKYSCVFFPILGQRKYSKQTLHFSILFPRSCSQQMFAWYCLSRLDLVFNKGWQQWTSYKRTLGKLPLHRQVNSFKRISRFFWWNNNQLTRVYIIEVLNILTPKPFTLLTDKD